MSILLTEPQPRRWPQLGGFGSDTMEKSDGGEMGNFESISVGGVCEVTFDAETKDYRGKPVSEKAHPSEQTAKLTTFRVTSSDELNRIKGKHFLGDILPELLAEGKTSNAEVQQIQDSYLISPPWNTVRISGKLSRPAYERFVDSRFKVLQAMVLKNLGYKD